MTYKSMYKNLNNAFQKKVEENPKALALRTKINNEWKEITREEYYNTSKNVGMALIELGINKDDRVGILSNTRIEWVYADMGILGIGAITVSLYQSSIIEEVEHILKDSGTSFLFVENKLQLEKIISIKDKLNDLKNVVLFEGDSELNWVFSFEEFLKLGEKHNIEEYKKISLEFDSSQVASIIYTSGTTGKPKGAVLTHLAFLASSDSIVDRLAIYDGSETFLFLPLAHVLAKMIHLLSVQKGMSIAFFESMDKIVNNIYETNPDFVVSVPRIYEKIYTKVITKVENGGIESKVFNWALSIGKKVSKLKLSDKNISYALNIQYKLADKLVFSKIKEKFGNKFKFFISGGAPLAKDISEFFHAMGVIISEGYGLTETSGAIAVNPIEKIKFGTIGTAMAYSEIKIAEDGEIICKGPTIMKEYYNNPEETMEALKDGWFHTGDIGEIDKDGYLKITDRKKDIIVTAAGKNIAPQHIENLVKASKYISQVIVLGDKKKYLVSLLNVDYEKVKDYADKNNISYLNNEDLIQNKIIFNLIEKEINSVNEKLPSYATIKYFKIIPKEFTIEDGELTPSLKIKRNFCMKKYRDLIDSMY